jgi:[acyl-carrier-protein] S-malonyltransferase
MSLALVFSGQGNQHSAMLPWLDASKKSACITNLEHILGRDWRAQMHDSAWASTNNIAQPLITGVSLAAWEQLQPNLPTPAAIVGYSVGEIAAFSAAGVFDAAIAMRLSVQRAQFMDSAVEGLNTALLAVSHDTHGSFTQLCTRFNLELAIDISNQQYVLGGLSSAIDAAQVEASAQGLHCTRLDVRLASHTSWLANAVAPMRVAMDAFNFAKPRCALICNLHGTVERTAPALREALALQIAQPIAWGRCMDTLAERGISCVLEIGPGNALSRMLLARHPHIAARSVDEFQHVDAIVDWVNTELAR